MLAMPADEPVATADGEEDAERGEGAVGTAASGEDGAVQFAKLSTGTYYLKELSAPDGNRYLLDEEIYEVKVEANLWSQPNAATT